MTRRVSTIRRSYVTTAQLAKNLAEVEEHARIRAEREAAADIAANMVLNSETPATDKLKADAAKELEELMRLVDGNVV